MGVLEIRCGFDLLHEPLGTKHRGERGSEDLDRDLAVVLDVVGEIDGCHAAFTQMPLDPVAVGEGCGEFPRDCRHGLQDGQRRSKSLA